MEDNNKRIPDPLVAACLDCIFHIFIFNSFKEGCPTTRVKWWEFEIVGLMKREAERRERQEIQQHMQVKRSFSFKLINRHAVEGSGQLLGKEFFYYCLPFQRTSASSPMVEIAILEDS